MAFTSIVGRQLDCPVINLGFSGNGRLDPEVGVRGNEVGGQVGKDVIRPLVLGRGEVVVDDRHAAAEPEIGRDGAIAERFPQTKQVVVEFPR